MKLLITGIDGFIGRNLKVRLQEQGYLEIAGINEASTQEDLELAASEADFVFHLAGVNRPNDPSEFQTGNTGFTESLCAALAASSRACPIIFTSSIQALLDNPY